MTDQFEIVQQAMEVLKIEAEGILHLAGRIDERFKTMVEWILASSGRVIVSGIGKSGIVGRKITATLNSTGTRSLFLHPVEAMHGDLGMVTGEDVLLALSNSGETEELNMMVPSIRAMGCPVIAFTGNPDSTLAGLSNLVIDTGVEREACPMGLAPTASTTALLAVGDALAVVLINKKRFNSHDFKRFHPGGALGKRLSNRVADLMLSGGMIPVVDEKTPMKDAVREMNRPGLGVTFIRKSGGRLAGIITDGDIRRAIVNGKDIFALSVEDVMTGSPLHVTLSTPAYDALNVMEEHEITVLPVLDENGVIQGILHLHDILGKGAFKFNGR